VGGRGGVLVCACVYVIRVRISVRMCEYACL